MAAIVQVAVFGVDGKFRGVALVIVEMVVGKVEVISGWVVPGPASGLGLASVSAAVTGTECLMSSSDQTCSVEEVRVSWELAGTE